MNYRTFFISCEYLNMFLCYENHTLHKKSFHAVLQRESNNTGRTTQHIHPMSSNNHSHSIKQKIQFQEETSHYTVMHDKSTGYIF